MPVGTDAETGVGAVIKNNTSVAQAILLRNDTNIFDCTKKAPRDERGAFLFR